MILSALESQSKDHLLESHIPSFTIPPFYLKEMLHLSTILSSHQTLPFMMWPVLKMNQQTPAHLINLVAIIPNFLWITTFYRPLCNCQICTQKVQHLVMRYITKYTIYKYTIIGFMPMLI